MSDPEASLAATSSSPFLPAADVDPLNYAFLVHSQKTLTQNLPPRVDNKLLARQKRRRTSPEDHAVLEAEYQRNPKPDKMARASIVNRVSLGEKEVQIWFQNRRQNDRRKSKPLQPHELLAPRPNMTDLSAQPASGDHASVEPGSSSGAEQTDLPDRHILSSKPWDGEVLQLSSELGPMSGDKEEHEHPLPSTQTSVATDVLEDTQTTVYEEPARDLNDASEESLLQPAKRKRSVSDMRGERVDDLQTEKSNIAPSVKSPPSLRLSLSFNGEAMVRKQDELTPSPPKGRNALRIAMSCDGKAVIRSEGEPSPSKNRVAMFSVRRTKLSGLRRSNSAIFPATPRPGMAEQDRVFGRSRDPRNWESFFDTDARSALSTPSSCQNAPNAASPRLFPSRSQRSLTRSLSARHSLLARAESVHTPVSQSVGDKRRKLSRTVSSLGRLETDRNRPSVSKDTKSLASQSAKPGLELDPGDSDKENWIPGTRSSRVCRRITTASSSHVRRPVLKEANPNLGLGILSHNNGKRNRPLNGSAAKANLPDVSAEVSAFMAGGAGASQEDDLDCVQGLLSLSQGAWR